MLSCERVLVADLVLGDRHHTFVDQLVVRLRFLVTVKPFPLSINLLVRGARIGGMRCTQEDRPLPGLCESLATFCKP